jgi:hypothetical protein
MIEMKHREMCDCQGEDWTPHGSGIEPHPNGDDQKWAY